MQILPVFQAATYAVTANVTSALSIRGRWTPLCFAWNAGCIPPFRISPISYQEEDRWELGSKLRLFVASLALAIFALAPAPSFADEAKVPTTAVTAFWTAADAV